MFLISQRLRERQALASITIRNVPDEVCRALRVRAAMHDRSAEAEIRDILEHAARPEGRVKLGSLLAQIGREVGGFDLTIERDRTVSEPVSFE